MDQPPKIPICVFAKPPRPGLAKTRLAAKVSNDVACDFATAFISDFITLASGYEWGYPVLATTDEGMPEGAFPSGAFPPGVRPEEIQKWLQVAGDLGAKLEGVMRSGLGTGADLVLCCGADSPGRPPARLSDAMEALRSCAADAVLGPTDDGGYDIIGLRACPEGLLADLPWSQPTTFDATKSRLEERGMRVAVLDKWWDVDEVEDLARLRDLLQGDGAARAPATAAVLARIEMASRTEAPSVPPVESAPTPGDT